MIFNDLNRSLIQILEDNLFESKELQVLVKRDDLLHPAISGNKWRKLKYNLQEVLKQKYSTVLTFGGAYSNHIYACAAACQELGLQGIGIIRGEAVEPLNPTLRFAKDCGMELHFVSRSAYADKAHLLKELNVDQSAVFVIPEGGSNTLALKGCAELVSEVAGQLDGHLPDYWCLSCGTGGTMAGLLCAVPATAVVHGFSALKGNFHQKLITDLLREAKVEPLASWQLHTEYHFGGYARYNQRLIDFINSFKQKFGIPLDPIYTGKLFFGIMDLIRRDYFKPGSSLLILHSGGLQGIEGFNQRFGKLLL